MPIVSVFLVPKIEAKNDGHRLSFPRKLDRAA